MPTIDELQKKHNKKMALRISKLTQEQRTIYIPPKQDGAIFNSYDWSHCAISRSYKKYRPGQSSTFPGRVNG